MPERTGLCSSKNSIVKYMRRVFAKDDVKIVVDPESFEFIKGATVDYEEQLIRSSFKISDNPLAADGCSCGSSFSVKVD